MVEHVKILGWLGLLRALAGACLGAFFLYKSFRLGIKTGAEPWDALGFRLVGVCLVAIAAVLLAQAIGAPVLVAAASQAAGALALSQGDNRSALEQVRRAWTIWQEIRVPYEAARARVLSGLTLRALGDEYAAELEFDAARWAFEQLEAVGDLARAVQLSRIAECPIRSCSRATSTPIG